jgi:diguanylate cyclase (GGDEF)-like protein
MLMPAGDEGTVERNRLEQALYAAVSIPLAILDHTGRVVSLNPYGQAFWGVTLDEVEGRRATDVLGIRPRDHSDLTEWLMATAFPALLRQRVPCQIATRDGVTHAAQIVGSVLASEGRAFTVIGIVGEEGGEPQREPPAWMLRDPRSGLANRYRWQREFGHWNGGSGAVLFLDLNDLDEVNQLYGAPTGDRVLALVGSVLLEQAPRDALCLRWGGDEFLVVLPGLSEDAAGRLGQAAADAVVGRAPAAPLPLLPQLSHGSAAYTPGTLLDAVREAADAMQEKKGALLRSQGGGQLLLTRTGRTRLRTTATQVSPSSRSLAVEFGREFEEHFRTQYTRAAHQAREFVAFVAPEAGSAAVEVGAGTGRITIDGGLAEAIGPQGQLLVTDPSEGQLQRAADRARAAGLDWLRFVPAPAESLPLLSGGADLVLGAGFLHFTRPELALREMARVARPKGRVALFAGLEFEWPPCWLPVLAPVRTALAEHGLPFRHFFLHEAELDRLLRAAGLAVERRQVSHEPWEFPTLEITVATGRQVDFVGLLSEGLPPEDKATAHAAYDERLAAMFAQTSPSERAWSFRTVTLVARREDDGA